MSGIRAITLTVAAQAAAEATTNASLERGHLRKLAEDRAGSRGVR
jgi:hypothetical protein